jgi:O-methyltransferase involved in polyketide biosynthesis
MPDDHPAKHQVRLGAVQETLFITLAVRAAETQRKHPVLRDPKAVELLQSIDYDAAKYGRGAGGFVTVLRTAIIDFWVREFLAAHPAATVVELGTGLNARFERVDNGQVHWFDLDLPDTIELRFGLGVRQSATITRPPRGMRARLPFRYRYLVPLADPLLGKAMNLTLFRASSPAAAGHAATAPDTGSA